LSEPSVQGRNDPGEIAAFCCLIRIQRHLEGHQAEILTSALACPVLFRAFNLAFATKPFLVCEGRVPLIAHSVIEYLMTHDGPADHQGGYDPPKNPKLPCLLSGFLFSFAPFAENFARA
jgi:hypothetical protein